VAKPGHLFAIGDYSAIEARVNAWCAGDEPALELFRSGGDPYKSLASSLFGVPVEQISKGDKRRQLGKAGELGCGYQMGGRRKKDGSPSGFEILGRDQYGVDWAELEKVGVTPESVVEIWRAKHPAIVDQWYNFQQAAFDAVDGAETVVGPTTWARVGDAVWCWLDSGRALIYHGMRLHDSYDPDTGKKRTGLVFDTQKGRELTYGGKLCENVVQKLSRDILAEAIVRCEETGLEVVLTVHDEIVCEVPEEHGEEALALQEKLMCTHPRWGVGIPLNVEGFLAKRYRK
jgi:DNA polymerase